MKKFSNFLNESIERVYLNDGRNSKGFYTNKKGNEYSISYLNGKISNYIKSIYGPFGYRHLANDDLNINGKIINSEYLDKMINNYKVWKEFIRVFSIKDEKQFYDEIIKNLDKIYHYNSNFFKKSTLPIIINSTRKGNKLEKIAKIRFEKLLSERGINANIENPTIEEDNRNIDAKFFYNNKYYTIQIKPFVSIRKSNGLFNALSQGSLKLGIDYLVLVRKNNVIILRNPKNNKIQIKDNYFIYNQDNILVSDV